jgi:hypothetical protein
MSAGRPAKELPARAQLETVGCSLPCDSAPGRHIDWWNAPIQSVNAANLGCGFPIRVTKGFNVTFTLASTPGSVVLIFRNGVLQQGGGVDYTLSGNTIAFVSAPLSGDAVLAVY